MTKNSLSLVCLVCVASACASERNQEQAAPFVPSTETVVPATNAVFIEPRPIVSGLVFRADDIVHAAEDIGLTVEQRTRIATLQDRFREQARPLTNALADAETNLRHALENPQSTRTDIRAWTQTLAAREADIKVAHMELLLDLREVLEPAQVHHLEQRLAQRRNRAESEAETARKR